jgi:fructokinase
MIVLSQLGGSAFYSCKVANDEWGDFYLQDLKANGVSTNVAEERSSGDSGKFMVMVTPDAQRSMNTYLGITENFSFDEIVEAELKKANYLYIEGYLVASPTAREAAVRSYDIALKHGVKTALTFSDPNMVQFFRDGMNEIIHDGVDLLFCNEDEAKTYAQVDDIEVAIQRIHQIAIVALITLGDQGALFSENGTQYRIIGKKVDAVDTNGAGDIFAGTFLYAINHGMSYEQAGTLACRIAERLVQSVGPRLSKELVQKLKA